MKRRDCLLLLAASIGRAAERLPANQNVRWALGANLWNSFGRVPFTDILDIMRDTGFIGIRLTQFPQILTTYSLTIAQMESEVSRRGLQVITVSFNGATDDPARHAEVLALARKAVVFLKIFDAKHLVVFSPRRNSNPGAFEAMCRCFNQIGEMAGELGFRAGLHNHLNQIVETPEEIDRCMALTDPQLFSFSPDTAHVHLGGGDVAAVLEKHKSRLMLADYKDAKRAALDKVKFLPNIYDLGDGEIDFPACHRVLKRITFKGWLCVDLDIARNGPRASYQRCGAYVVRALEPVYVYVQSP